MVPLAPAAGGNGLAMRAGLLLEAMAGAGPVDSVIAPVSGPAAAGPDWRGGLARRIIVALEPPGDSTWSRSSPTRTVAPMLRGARALPGEAAARAADSGASAVDVDGHRPALVVVMRSYLAPFGDDAGASARDAARGRSTPTTTTSGCCATRGDEREADAHVDLAAPGSPACRPRPRGAPGRGHGDGERARPSRSTNCPTRCDGRRRWPSRRVTAALLYRRQPHVRAEHRSRCATWSSTCCRSVRREVPQRDRRRRRSRTTIVWPVSPVMRACASPGAVPRSPPGTPTPTSVVVPLREGAGTRIKVLEAFAHGRPGGRHTRRGRRTRGPIDGRRCSSASPRRGSRRRRRPSCVTRPEPMQRSTRRRCSCTSTTFSMSSCRCARQLLIG